MKLVKVGDPNDSILTEDLTLLPDCDPTNVRAYHAQMSQLCKQHGGIGLSANQVGRHVKLFFVTAAAKVPSLSGGGLIINPKIVSVPDKPKRNSIEGCLSLPGKQFLVMRHASITAEWQNVLGHSFKKVLNGTAAIVFQHEYDHLKGITLLQSAAREL